VLLSDVDGFYTANPKEDPNAARFDLVETITPEIEAMAGDPISGLSKGGMKTKLLAAKTAVPGGCAMAIMEGSVLRPLKALARARTGRGSLPRVIRRRRASAGCGDEAQGRGAGRRRGHGARVAASRCLPAGVTVVLGSFGRGEPVAILSPEGGAWQGAGALYCGRGKGDCRAQVGRDRSDPGLCRGARRWCIATIWCLMAERRGKCWGAAPDPGGI
jgi:glutamate 5-kinase